MQVYATQVAEEDPMVVLNRMLKRDKITQEIKQVLDTEITRFIFGMDRTSVFFAHLILPMGREVQYDAKGYMATDGFRLYFDPGKLEGKSPKAYRFILAHECCHIAGDHFPWLVGKDLLRANLAADAEINPMLRDAGFEPEGLDIIWPGLYKTQQYPDGLPEGKTADWYYLHLPQHIGTWEFDPKNGTLTDPTGKKYPAPVDWITPNADKTPFEMKQELDQRKIRAGEAAENSGHGDYSEALGPYIHRKLHPSVRWQDQLWDTVQSHRNLDDYSFYPVNPRYVSQGDYLPTMTGKEVGHLINLIDVSGSITEGMLDRYGTEEENLCSVFPSKVSGCYHDTDVLDTFEWDSSNGGPLELKMMKGGGTDHRPAFKWAMKIEEESEQEPTAILVFTDLMTSFPTQAPKTPVIWIVPEQYKGTAIPFGKVIYVPVDQQP